MKPDPSDYVGREQAYVKHVVLQKYLQRLAYKVAQFRPGTTLNYIDGFSGPWDAVRSDQGDCSPAIAMAELAQARDALARRPIPVPMNIRCMFVERDASAYARLMTLCEAAPGIETLAMHGRFEDHIARAAAFAAEGPNPFAFVFIDPKGWKGYALGAITPLLRVAPSEVLINLMTGFAGRFIDDEESSAVRSFEDLFGEDADTFRARWAGLTGLDREDAIVTAYCDSIREAGGFTYCTSTLVVKALADRTLYRLVYATRSRFGLLAFRESERAALKAYLSVRATAKREKRESKHGQTEMFAPEVTDTNHLDALADRYAALAEQSALTALGAVGNAVPYEALVDAALAWPMTAETTLKDWIVAWRAEGRVEFVGSFDRPKLDAGHRVRRVR